MLGRSHAVIGVASLWAVAAIPSVWNAQTAPVMAGCAAFGALLPDIDAGAALVAQFSIAGIHPFAPISLAARSLFEHRGVLHSLLGTLLFGGPVALLIGRFLGLPGGIAVILGYLSHLAADACTVSGIPLLFPDRTKRYLPAKSQRFVTGSFTEDVILLAAAEACIALMLLVMHSL